MSDQQNEIVALANEYQRLQRQLVSKTQQLDALMSMNGEAGDFPPDFAGNELRRYSIDFPFVPGVLEPQEGSVTVEAGSTFRCAYVESFVRAVGTADDPYSGDPSTAQVTLPWDVRQSAFDYMWRVRDTGTDREWVEPPQPALFGGGGYVGPLWLPRRVVLGGGTVIYATLDPFVSAVDGVNFFASGGVTGYTVQMSFVGHDVPDGSPL